MNFPEVTPVGSALTLGSTADRTDSNSSEPRGCNRDKLPTTTSLIQDDASQIDQEVLIQKERITIIIDSLVRKSKLAIALPVLMKEFTELKAVLAPRQLQDALLIYKQYHILDKCNSAHLFNAQAIEDIKAGDLSIKNRISPELARLIQMLSTHRSLHDIAEKIIQEAMASGESPVTSYMQSLLHLRQLVMRQIDTSAADYLSAKLRTRGLIAANNKLNIEIHVIQTALQMEQQTFDRQHLKRTMMFEELGKEEYLLEKNNKHRLPKIILDSERSMVLASRQHELEMEMLREEEAVFKETYLRILDEHLIDEKQLRARRVKVKTQLAGWVQKYDLEMKEKQQGLEDVTLQYESEAERVKDLEAQLSRQDEEYTTLMAERTAEYEEEMESKLTKFLREHAARVVQSAWRQVLENRREKLRRKRATKKVAVPTKEEG